MNKHIILFHGRHILHTKFQEQKLSEIVRSLQQKTDKPIEVVFAVTSSNHANSRYNPVPFHYRAIGIDLFSRKVLLPLGTLWCIVPIPHTAPTDKFASHIIAYTHALHQKRLELSPDTTVVLCSTPSLIEQFSHASFSVDTAEYDLQEKKFIALTPQIFLKEYAAKLTTTVCNSFTTSEVSQTTLSLWQTYPEIPEEIERLWNESMLTEHGDITETRDYGTYSFSMSRSEVLERKYLDIKDSIVPGLIVDEGCADGALLACIAKNFPDSDLIGVEITREFLAEAQERQRRGEFGNSFVFFYQRNLGNKIFADDTVTTTICNSTTHEIWSYGGGDTTLRTYLAYKYAQLKPGGVLLVRDVIGPENGEEEIYAWFNDKDGITPNTETVHEHSVAELSTLGRFYRFSREFFNGRGVHYSEEIIEGRKLIKLARKDAADFLSKKSYVDNWQSELHEDFTHWSFSRWQTELSQVGFTIDMSRSHVYTNPWIVEHHFERDAELFRESEGRLEAEPFPPTTVVLVAIK